MGKILLCDDEESLCRSLGRILRAAGHEVVAMDGVRGYARLKEERFDLILTDIRMPDVNGFDVVEALRSRPDTARIPIVVVTAKQITPEDRAKLSGYVSTIVEKSGFDPDGFTAEIRRAMAGRAPAA